MYFFSVYADAQRSVNGQTNFLTVHFDNLDNDVIADDDGLSEPTS